MGRAVTGFDVLDPYRFLRRGSNVGPLELEASLSNVEPDEDVFAYLSGDAPTTLPLLSALAASGLRGKVFVRRGTPRHRAALARGRLDWLDVPERIQHALDRSRLVVHHGSMRMAEEALVAGRPQVVAPLYLEHLLTARALVALGVAVVLRAAQSADELIASVRRAATSQAFSRAARAWAQRYAQDVPAPTRTASALMMSIVAAVR